MPPTYYAIFTTLGLTRLAEAQAAEEPLVFTHLAVGDGGGAPITPNASMTALVNERARVAVNTTEVSPDAPTTVRVEGIIPAATGGFTIREAGLFNASGELIAVASYPPIYKPVPADGVSVDEYIRILLTYAEVEAIALTTDPNVIIASRRYVDEQLDFWNSTRVKLWREHFYGVLTSPADGKIADSPQLTAHIGGTGEVSVLDPQEAYGGRFLMFGGSDNTGAAFVASSVPVVYPHDDRVISLEFEMEVSNATNATHHVGLGDDPELNAATEFARLEVADGVFQLEVSGGGGEAAFVPTLFGFRRVRLQIFGANTPHAVANGAAFTRLLIDDEEVARVNAVPSGALYVSMGMLATDSPATSLLVGGFVLWWLTHSRPMAMPPLTDAHVERGYSAITEGSGDGHDYLDVTFDRPFDAATGEDGYDVDVTILTHYGDVVGWNLISKTTTGMRIQFTASFDGEVRWRAYK